MSAWDVFPRGEIEHVCSYMPDDGTIAAYFGVSREQIAEVRSKLPKSKQFHQHSESATKNAGLGLEAQRTAEQDARCGSQRLNEALHELFQRWEQKHGFREGAGKLLLPAGWTEKRQEVAA